MRKNFTQLFMGLALILGFSVVGNSQCDPPILPPPGAIYNYQFDGSSEGWRSLDAAGFENNNLWQWSETGDLKMGAYSTNYPDVIESESQCNGAMVMDSDFLDNNGSSDPADAGTGDCPADCNAYLVSPVMDLSGASSVELLFTQSVRQFFSSYFVYVSTDGGATNSDTIEINDDLILNAAVSSKSLVLPLCSAGGFSEVVVTFHYEANYYVWAIDDVSIVPAEEVIDMRVNKNFYAKVGNYETPRNMGIPHIPLVDIENLRAFENPGSTVNFRMKNDVDEVLFSSSREYGPVPCLSTDENKLFDGTFEMPIEEGTYSLEYEMVAPGDVNPDNDLITAPFKITNSSFRKLPTEEEYGSEFLTGVRYGGSYCSWASYFYIPQNEKDQAIESVSLGIVTQGEAPSPGIITVAVYQWVDFDDIGSINSGERVLLGEVDQFIPPDSPAFLQWTVTPLDPEGNKIIPEPGAELIVIGHSNPFDGVTNYFFNCVGDSGFEEYSQGATNLAHREAELLGGYGSFASGDSASDDDKHDTREFFNIDGAYVFDISMELTPLDVGTEDINEDLGVKIFPSPASTLINVDLNLENFSEAVSIELMDVSGNKLRQFNYTNIQKDRLSIDVSDLPGGMYLVNVRTKDGMTSKKVTVIH